MTYSTPYIIFVVFILMIAYFQNSLVYTKRLNLLIPLSFFFFFGFRGFIGWDWNIYYPTYNDLPIYANLDTSEQFQDVGFVIFSSLMKSLHIDFHCFVAINTLIDVLLLHFFFKRYLTEKQYAFGFALFLVFGGFVMETDLMRNVKSLLLFLVSLKYIEERNIYKFLILNLLGLSFHWSAIVFFPTYFFLHKSFSLKTVCIVMLIGMIIYLIRFEYVKPFLKYVSSFMGEKAEERIEDYLKSPIFLATYGFSIGFFERMGTLLATLCFYKKLTINMKHGTLFVNSFLIYSIIFLYFSEVTIVITRFGGLFSFSYWVLWIMLIGCFNNRNTKIVLVGAMSLIIIIKMSLLSGNILYQYDSVLFGDKKTFKERQLIFNTHYKQLQK